MYGSVHYSTSASYKLSLWVSFNNLCPSTLKVKNYSYVSSRRTCNKQCLSITPLVSSFPICHKWSLLDENFKRSSNSQEAPTTYDLSNTKFRTICSNPLCSLTTMESEEARELSETCNADSNMFHHRPPCSSIPINFRNWEFPNQDNIVSDSQNFRFKLLSYNVLAQCLLEWHPYLYTRCFPQNLKWERRSELIYDEILKLSPDILCLQEVQSTHLNSFYSKFEEIGYYGMFKQKTGHNFDGCAIYFKKSVFELQDHLSVEFLQPGHSVLNRDNIGLIVKLAPRSAPNCPFVVATTHLLYNPKRTDVRLAQMQLFLAEIDRFSFDNNRSEPGYLPIILTGDLNSTPESGVIQLLDNGQVSAGLYRDSSEWQKIGVTNNCQHLSVHLNRPSGKNFSTTKIYNSDYSDVSESCSEKCLLNCEYNELFNTGILEHFLKFKSVYDKVKIDGQCEATTFQDYWVTVDYIYFTSHSRLNVVERFRLPTASECEVLGYLPNNVYGSDHICLGAVFDLKLL